MPHRAILLASFVTAGLLTATGQTYAESKSPGQIKEAVGRCYIRATWCDTDCDQLIDVDNNVRDCKNRCEVKRAKCTKRAQTMEAPLKNDSLNDTLETAPSKE